MNTKFLVIPLNLNADDIINTDLDSLTSESRHMLDKALAIARVAKKITIEKEKAKEEKQTLAKKQLETVHGQLLEKESISATDIKAIIGEEGNLSAFMLKLKNHLAEQDNTKTLEKYSISGKNHYRLK